MQNTMVRVTIRAKIQQKFDMPQTMYDAMTSKQFEDMIQKEIGDGWEVRDWEIFDVEGGEYEDEVD